jgi:16S rRNA (cytosine967-C5)-methyltransferase
MRSFKDGLFYIQDPSTLLAVRELNPQPGESVLDLCAAPGGKTAQLVAAGANVVALDRSPRRVERLNANLARLKLAAETRVADAIQWRPDQPARFILLDAPCTATGAIRRHPDVPHLKSPEDVIRLAAVQERLLAAAIEMLAPGGMLVYCTCSLEPQEGKQQIQRLLAQGAPVKRSPVDPAEIGGLAECVSAEGDLRTLPCHLADRDGLDGFFAARLMRV